MNQRKITNRNSRHAISRAKERYGLDLSIEDLGKIKYMICSNQSVIKLINNVGECRQVHSLKYQGKKIFPVYDERSGLIVTFYSEEMVNI